MGLRFLICALVLPLLWAQNASALRVTHAMAGEITEVGDGIATDGRPVLDGLGVAVGDPFTGTISWETTNPNARAAAFVFDRSSSGFDIFELISFSAVDNLPTGLGNLRVIGLDAFLRSGNLLALRSDALPTTLDLALWDDTQAMAATIVRSGRSQRVIGQIDTLTLVPEASTALLVGLGLIAVLSARRH